MRISDWSSDVCSSDLRDLEHVARDQILEALAHTAAAAFGGAAVDDHAERVDRLVVDEEAHLDEVARTVADLVIVEASVAARNALQSVVEVEHDLVQIGRAHV